MALNFNTEPYYDDYSEDKKFQKILFRPSYAIQARELTQLQTILQKQIERTGNHLFRDGSMVIPGQISYDTTLSYVKLTNSFGTTTTDSILSTLVGKTISGSTTGVTAKILTYTKRSGSDPSMIYVKYLDSGTNNETKTFSPSEILVTEEVSVIDQISVQVAASDTTPIGFAAGASIQQGVYYVKGYFVLAEEQTIVLSKYTKTPSAKVGLNIIETIVTPEQDETLLDNAQDSYNYAAPGAHRYMIDLVLTSKPVDDTGHGDFIELLRLRSGIIEYIVDRTEYAQIEQTLARRTYDESGNYTVKPFDIDVREYRDNNRGTWTAGRAYLAGDVVSFYDSVQKKTLYYTARNSEVSLSNIASPLNDTRVTWDETAAPIYNRGVYKPENNATLATNNAMEAQLAIGIEAGKAYIFGHEIEKISTTYVAVDKARATAQENNQLIPLDLGQYIIVSNVNALPNISTFPQVTLHNRYSDSVGLVPNGSTAIGTARIRAIEKHSGTIGASAQYKVFLFDINMSTIPNTNKKYDFINSAKQLYIRDSSNTAAKNFTADIVATLVQGSGSVSNTSTAVTGVLTKFTTEFAVGDYVRIGGSLARITAIASNTSMTLSSNLGGNKTGQAIYKETCEIQGFGTSLLYTMPNYAIGSLSDIEYYVYRKFTQTAGAPVAGRSQLQITTDIVTDQFTNPNDSGNYLVTNRETGLAVNFTAVRSNGNKTITFTLDNDYEAAEFDIIATVFRTGENGLKTKQLLTTTKVFDTAVATSAKQLFLGKADGYKLISVKMKTGTFASPGASYSIDVTGDYIFATGQTDSYYGISYLTLKDGKSKAAAPIQVTYQYFNHIGTGDFFCVNSYSTIDYKKIPTFSSVSLRDCIDFRPRVDDSSTGAVVFTGNNDNSPKYGQDFTCSYTYYLGRKSKIFMGGKGNLFVKDSAPSLAPLDPSDSNDGMLLYKLDLEPFTFNANDTSVDVTTVDNKRYTMRDIGNLEKRINNLEYYTSLSLLETETKALAIPDEEGLERFKNGFIVDNFTGHVIGDIVSPDYMNSMDFDTGELRPFYTMNQVDFVEIYSTNAQRAGSNYQVTGDLATLPYTHELYINQPQASMTVNVNPFAIFTFIGSLSITPPYDNWFEVTRRPDLIVSTIDGNYNTIKTIAEKAGVLGTVWNAWQTQWTGKTVVTGTSKKVTFGFDSTDYGLGAGRWMYRGTFSAEDRALVGGDANLGGPGGGRVLTYTTTATQVGQSRTGIQTSLKETFERKTLEDKVLSTAVIPYIRSRKILIQSRGLKPNTRFYPYFDEKDVSIYCRPAEKITFTAVSGYGADFDSQTNVGNDYKEDARLTAGNMPDMSLNIGDVVYGWRLVGGTYVNTGASGIVVGEEITAAGVRSIYIVNTKDSKTSDGDGFSVGDQIRGSISGARGNITAYTKRRQGDPLTTNINGAVDFIFDIPNTSSVRFRTGTRELTLLDISRFDRVAATSNASGTYSASGQLQERQNQVQLIRNAEIVTTRVTQDRTITNTNTQLTGDTGWYDPLAQTFLVEEKTGVFVTKVSVYFSTKSTSVPVSCHIVQTVNGYPSQKIVPFSKVSMLPERVNVSANGSVATVFNFAAPVYLAPNTEYALVLMSDSNDYKVWVAKMGEKNIGTDDFITKQPYAGVFFKSQNASTWTAEQEQDLKFTVHRAKFTTNSVATVDFENIALTDVELDYNPFQLTAGSNVIRVNHINHGMPTGAKVSLRKFGAVATGEIYVTKGSKTVTGVGTFFTDDFIAAASNGGAGTNLYRQDGTLIGEVYSIASDTSLQLVDNAPMTYGKSTDTELFRFANPFYGISAANIYKDHTISNVELDSYTITISDTANTTVYAGEGYVRATYDVPYDLVQPNLNIQQFSETPISVKYQGVTGKSVNGTQTPYKTFSYLSLPYNDIMNVTVGENNQMPVPMTIASDINASTQGINLSSRSTLRNSAILRVEMYSTSEYLSPVIDVRNVNVNAISNKVNKPTSAMNIATIDDVTIASANSNIKFTTRTNVTFAKKLSNTVTITTASPHGLTVGDVVVVDIVQPSGYDGNFDGSVTVVSVPSNDTFTYAMAGADVPEIEVTSGSASTTTGSQYVMIDDSSLWDNIATIYSGQYVTISGSSVTANNGTFLVTDVDPAGKFLKFDNTFNAGTGNITIVLKDRYFSEITPYGSSAYSKYVTRRIQLAYPSTFLKIKFAASIPPKADIEVYYKLNPIGQNLDFNYVEYVKAPTTADTFVKSLDGSFRDVELDMSNLTPFDAVAVKIVFLSTESTQIPTVQELRIIACA